MCFFFSLRLRSSGAVSATGSSGAGYTLTMPAGALIGDRAISVTPLASAAGTYGPIAGHSWSVEILPFLDQANLYNKMNWTIIGELTTYVATTDPAFNTAVQTVVPTYICPTSPRNSSSGGASAPMQPKMKPL